ncbi:MAG: hypothetical protein KC484_03480 [Colwelliaceae bacterium]|jgi:hypothetical protein|nr:hypothetical protein [Colwelliaceae bacterium]
MKKSADETKTNLLMLTGLLTENALLESMCRSKTLTIMVVVMCCFFAGLGYFLFSL